MYDYYSRLNKKRQNYYDKHNDLTKLCKITTIIVGNKGPMIKKGKSINSVIFMIYFQADSKT